MSSRIILGVIWCLSLCVAFTACWNRHSNCRCSASVTGAADLSGVVLPIPVRPMGSLKVRDSPILESSMVSYKKTTMCLANTVRNDTSSDFETERLPLASRAMLGVLRTYRAVLSPVLPPNCRFIPSCSIYGIEAVERFGPARGALLTFWRLLRCNPTGGRGYDPPIWPPPPYRSGS